MTARERMYYWERAGFAAALLFAAVYIGAEAWAVVRGNVQPRPIPWGFLFVEGGLLFPITLGRLTAGRVWEILASKLPGGRNDLPPL